MKGEECKLPIPEDYPNFFTNGKYGLSLKNKKLLILAWFLLLITMSIMIGFTFRSLTEIGELKEEIGKLKVSIQFLNKKIIDFESTEYTEDSKFLEDNNHYDDDYYDITYDDEDSEYEDNDIFPDDVRTLLMGENFTKDAKQSTTERSESNTFKYSQDEVAINADTYEEQRKKNRTVRSIITTPTPTRPYSYPLYSHLRVHQDIDNHLTSPSPRRLKFTIQKNNDQTRGKMSSNLKSGDSYNSRENSDVEFTVVNDDQMNSGRGRHRQRRLELDERGVRVGRMRPLPTAHFNGDTSKYVLGQHENFDGNGRLKHPQRTFVDWSESSWFHTLEMDRYFSYADGVLTVKEPGLYFIYAQIYYFDAHDTNGFRVYRNDTDTLLQCTTMTHSMTHVLKGNTCFTAAAEYLHENDRISLGDLSDARYSLFEPGKSFFGVIKLGDVKILK